MNDKIYYANADKGLHIIDVKDPGNPAILETITGTIGAWDIHINDGHLFLGKHGNGFSVFQMEQDGSLSHVFSGLTGGEVYGIYYEDDRLYTGDLVKGVQVRDVSEKSQPLLLHTLEEYSPHDIVVRNGLVYLADQDRHFVILNI